VADKLDIAGCALDDVSVAEITDDVVDVEVWGP
jgi:hypothetical protein